MEEDIKTISVSYCSIDRLYYIRLDGKDIQHQERLPTPADIAEALVSDDWIERFRDMRQGMRVRVSAHIYYEMMGSVPPINQTATSFYCGEPYSGGYHYYFERANDGLIYGQLKELPNV